MITVLPKLVLEAVLGIVTSVSSLSLSVDSLSRSLSVESLPLSTSAKTTSSSISRHSHLCPVVQNRIKLTQD